MTRRLLAVFAIAAVGVTALAGCQGGTCSNCGAGYAGGFPTSPQNAYAQPYIQPGVASPPPGVVVPQQIIPPQTQPVYGGSGTR